MIAVQEVPPGIHALTLAANSCYTDIRHHQIIMAIL